MTLLLPPPTETNEWAPEAPAPALEPVRPAAPPPAPAGAPEADDPRARRRFNQADLVEIVGPVAAGIALSLLLRVVLDWDGIMGTFLWAVIGFMVTYWVLIQERLGRLQAADRLVTMMIWGTGVVAVAFLTWLVGFVIVKGVKALTPSFFTEDLSKTGPLNPGGGAFHALIGTIEQVGIATVVVVPIAILTAVYLNELKGRGSSVIRFTVDAVAGLPSIVAGLLIFTLWVAGHGFSGVACSAALAILMLPTVTRTSEEILRTVPGSLREASLALGAPRWKVVGMVVLPTARAGLLTAVILGIARAIGETAPALLTALGSARTNLNPFTGPQANLPLFVWSLIRTPNQTQIDRAWTGALVLLMLIFVLFTLARFLGNRSQKKLGRSR